MRLISTKPSDTYDIGFIIGKNLGKYNIICIQGPMGAGKTALSQGLLRGIGVTDKYITSPTYTIVNTYEVLDEKVYHFDVYRIEDYDELLIMGFEEYLEDGDVIVIEWADLIRENLPENCLWINIENDEFEHRIISINKVDEHISNELSKWEEISENTSN